MKDINVNVNHITRVEGHGNIVVNVQNGKIEKCEWQVPEAPRFFESMIRGRHYSEVARITSRICGICAVGHTLASIKATEDALGIKITPQTRQLRTLLKLAEVFDSHIVHLLFLVAPDLMGAKSVFPLVPTHGEVIKKALRLKRFGHELGSLIGGRTTHPTKPVPGGFASLPTIEEIKEIHEKLESEVQSDLNDILNVLVSLKDQIPAFDRPTEYIALADQNEYGLYDGNIQSILPDNQKESWPVSKYLDITNEYVVSQSTAKYCKNKLDTYAVGALARFNNNFDLLHPEAKKVAGTLGMSPLNTNPYMNNIAQVVEVVHSYHEVNRILDEILLKGLQDEPLMQPTEYGTGFGAVEVPRGILFHSYTYDDDGMCTKGNCIIPTNQNHANIQADFEKRVPELLDQNATEQDIELSLEMLVRAYDPCISCSTHFLKVKFV